MLDHWFNGQLTLQELFSSYSHVRMALASSVQIALATLTNWNLKSSFLFINLVMLLTAVFIGWTINKNMVSESSSLKRLFAYLTPLALFLSLRNWENFLLGMQINMSLGICLSVFSLYALSSISKKSFFIALVSAVGSAFSYTNALLVLPLGALILAIQRKWKFLLVWGGFSLVLLVGYVSDGWGGSGQMTILGRNIISMSEYFILLASSPVSLAHSIISSDGRRITENDLVVAAFLGLFVFAVSLYALVKFLRSPKSSLNLFFASLILWALGSMAFVTLARENFFGVKQALAPRYAWFVSVLICGDIGLLVSKIIWDKKRARLVTVSLLALIYIAYMSSFSSEMRVGPFRRIFFENWASTVKNYKTLTDAQVKDELRDSKSMREMIMLVEKNQLSVFSK